MTINGINWRICFVRPNNPYLQRADGGYSLGCTDCNLCAIFIADDLPLRKTRDVICHELCHAMMFSHGFYIDEFEEEAFCKFCEYYADDILHMTYGILNNLKKNNGSP